MDIVRKKKKKNPLLKQGVMALAIVSAIAFVGNYAMGSKHTVSSNTVLLDAVQHGDFNIDVRGVGVLVPKKVYWLSTEANGRVETVHIKAGARVNKGDPIVTLSNHSLEQQLQERQWELEETKAQLNAQRVSLESQVLDQETLVVNSKLNYERALLTFNAQKKLLKQGIVDISTVEHEEVKIEVEQFLQRWKLEQKRLLKSNENLAAQKLAFNARLQRMERMLARIQHQVDNLEITASIDSIVQEMPLEIGQQVGAGSNVARLARNDNFIAEIRIPEQQIYQIALDHPVTIDTKTNKVAGKVIRIDPAVINGTVQVDVELTGAIPKEARPELTVDGIIHVATLSQTLFMKRPMYAKANTQGTVYLVDDSKNVNLTNVEFGRSSQTHIEIKKGLSIGDNVVVSDVSSWKEKQIQAIQ